MNTSALRWENLRQRDSKLAKTVGYYSAFVALGLVSASLGPTLHGLAANTQSTLSQISYLFVARSFGYLLGSILAGRVYDRQAGHPLIVGALGVIMIMMIGVPSLSVLGLLIAILLILGLAEGLLDVGVNTLLVWVHQPKIGPYMNALHFFFGLGAFFSPLIVAQTIQWSGDITWAYRLFAILLVPVLLWFIRLPSPPLRHTTQDETRGPTNYVLVGILVLFFFLFVGVEVSYSGWIYTYAVTTGLADATSAAYLNSIFWGTFTVGRLIGIPLAARFRPRTILLTDLLGCLVSVAIVLIWPTSAMALWIGVAGAGLAMASIFAVTLSWAERRVHITGFITSCFFIGTSSGAMFFPWFIGQLFDAYGPHVTMFTILATDLAAFVLFIVLMLYGGRPKMSRA
ncbi:MAG: MFS transporter [Caldilineaceae bacterium]|nr:MFS transporter [Caldilineaceae bacterium]